MIASKTKGHIDLSFATVELRDDGIVHTKILLDYEINLEHAQQLLDAYLEVGYHQKRPHLFTLRKFVLPEKDVMEFVVEVANEKGVADAFIIHSLPQKIIANFYMRFYKPKLPTRFFNSEQKALEWLKKYLD